MKKIISILLLIVFFVSAQQVFAFGKKKNKKHSNDKGYYGRLPNINGEFGEERKSKETQSPIILNDNSFKIDSKDYTCDQIALLFAKQLIKRLKTE